MSVAAQPSAPPVAAPSTPTAASAPGLPARIGRLLSTAVLLVAAMALVAVLVAAANGVRVRVEQTGSMAPQLQPGDLVLVRQTPLTDIRVGDVIGVRSSSGAVIVHRVQRLDGAGAALRVTTKGDANPTSEQWTLQRTSDVALVRGKVPALGTAVDALKGPLAALIVMLAALILAVAQLRRIWSRS